MIKETVYRCEYCDEVFDSEDECLRHEKKHCEEYRRNQEIEAMIESGKTLFEINEKMQIWPYVPDCLKELSKEYIMYFDDLGKYRLSKIESDGKITFEFDSSLIVDHLCKTINELQDELINKYSFRETNNFIHFMMTSLEMLQAEMNDTILNETENNPKTSTTKFNNIEECTRTFKLLLDYIINYGKNFLNEIQS